MRASANVRHDSSKSGSSEGGMDLHPDLMDLLAAFSSSNVEYLVIGGWAVSVHTEPRFTKDLDLLLDNDPANIARAASALETFGAPADVVGTLEKLGPEEFMFFGIPPARIDVLLRVPGIEFRDAWPRRVDVPLQGFTVHVIGRDDLIATKRAAGREKDLRDLRALERR
jgi:hypothetical protein